MEPKSGSDLGRQMLAAVKDYFARATEPILSRVAGVEQKLAELPAPVPGAAGRDGVDGKDGAPGPAGEAGVQGEPGQPGRNVDFGVVEALVKEAVAALPSPQDGIPGEKGDAGRDGRDGKDGREGIDGVNGANGLDGKNGRDALHIDEFAAELKDDGRTIAFRLSSGGRDFSSEVRLDVPLDCGVYRQGTGYAKGDFVTWDGSGWIAQKATDDKPGTSDAWRLSIKRGRDGKDGGAVAAAAPREPVRLK